MRLGETFKTSGSGESPAGSTLSLILDGGNKALRNPINIGNSDSKVVGLNILEFGGLESEVGLGELFLGEGGELVDSHVVGLAFLGVMGLDLGGVFEEVLFFFFLPNLKTVQIHVTR